MAGLYTDPNRFAQRTDTPGRAQGRAITLGDSAVEAVFDDDFWPATAGGGTVYNDSLVESIALADSLTAQAVFASALTETVAPADAASSAATFAAALTETVTLSDGATVTVIMAATLAEAIAVADALGATQIMLATVGETITLTATFDSTLSGTAVWPNPADVRAGVVYGPTGVEYTGVLAAGGQVWLRRR